MNANFGESRLEEVQSPLYKVLKSCTENDRFWDTLHCLLRGVVFVLKSVPKAVPKSKFQ